MWRWLTRLTAPALVAGLLIIPATQAAANGDDPLAAVRHATDKFHSVAGANAAG